MIFVPCTIDIRRHRFYPKKLLHLSKMNDTNKKRNKQDDDNKRITIDIYKPINQIKQNK